MKSEDNNQKELSLEEKRQVITEIKNELNNGFRILGFDGGQIFPLYPYYFYFGDPDKELRRYSVGVFAIWLGYWRAGCSFRFYRQSELYKYIKSLVQYQEEIEKEFPVIHAFIAYFLKELTQNYTFSDEFRMKTYIVEIVNKDFLDKQITEQKSYLKGYKYDDFLEELYLAPF